MIKNDFTRVQESLTAGFGATVRPHIIPMDVRKFASDWKMANAGNPGRGHGDVPSLPDIYYQLTREGLDLMEAGGIGDFVFENIEKGAGAVTAQIIFDDRLDLRLSTLKAKVDAGEYQLKPYTRTRKMAEMNADRAGKRAYTRSADLSEVSKEYTYKTISLASLAVNLMRLAIAERQKIARNG